MIFLWQVDIFGYRTARTLPGFTIGGSILYGTYEYCFRVRMPFEIISDYGCHSFDVQNRTSAQQLADVDRWYISPRVLARLYWCCMFTQMIKFPCPKVGWYPLYYNQLFYQPHNKQNVVFTTRLLIVRVRFCIKYVCNLSRHSSRQ